MLTVADFFCGAGGFSEGFRQKGFVLAFALDYWQPAINTLGQYNAKCKLRTMDIRDLNSYEKIEAIVPDVDVIIGSPPCVSFSHSNKTGKADKTLGLELITSFLRIVSCKMKKGSLKYWIMENVPNAMKYIHEEYGWKDLGLSGTGPSLRVPKKLMLNAADFGAPQERLRIFAGDYPDPEETHDSTSWLTIRDVFRALGEPLSKDRQGWIEDPVYPIRIMKSALTDHFYDTRIEEWKWSQARRLKEDHGFMGKMPFPDDIDRPSRTVLATRSASTREAMIFGVERDEEGQHKTFRLPTIREIGCFMSFPVTYQFEGNSEEHKYRLVGNAVACKQAAALAKAILEEEGADSPEIGPLPKVTPSADLTGFSREMKPAPRRRKDARFARHIPYMKEKGYRVELTNRHSDFHAGKVVWSAVLHKGTGRKAKFWEYGLDRVSEFFYQSKMRFQTKPTSKNEYVSRFSGFEKKLEEAFNARLPDAVTFQRLFTRREKTDSIGPDEALETIRNLVDRYFPEQGYGSATIKNHEGITSSDPEEFPVRIIVGLFACEYIVDLVMNTHDKDQGFRSKLRARNSTSLSSPTWMREASKASRNNARAHAL